MSACRADELGVLTRNLVSIGALSLIANPAFTVVDRSPGVFSRGYVGRLFFLEGEQLTKGGLRRKATTGSVIKRLVSPAMRSSTYPLLMTSDPLSAG